MYLELTIEFTCLDTRETLVIHWGSTTGCRSQPSTATKTSGSEIVQKRGVVEDGGTMVAVWQISTDGTLENQLKAMRESCGTFMQMIREVSNLPRWCWGKNDEKHFTCTHNAQYNLKGNELMLILKMSKIFFSFKCSINCPYVWYLLFSYKEKLFVPNYINISQCFY